MVRRIISEFQMLVISRRRERSTCGGRTGWCVRPKCGVGETAVPFGGGDEQHSEDKAKTEGEYTIYMHAHTHNIIDLWRGKSKSKSAPRPSHRA